MVRLTKTIKMHHKNIIKMRIRKGNNVRWKNVNVIKVVSNVIVNI